MSKVAVVFWTGSGNTEIMATAVADGAKSAGAEVDTYTAAEFDAAKAAGYAGIAFGCPAMGAEELEDTEFEPMFAGVEGSLGGKKVGIFGSYGWGDGEWMRNWADRCRNNGIALVNDGVMCNGEPDDAGKAECADLGKAIAQ